MEYKIKSKRGPAHSYVLVEELPEYFPSLLRVRQGGLHLSVMNPGWDSGTLESSGRSLGVNVRPIPWWLKGFGGDASYQDGVPGQEQVGSERSVVRLSSIDDLVQFILENL